MAANDGGVDGEEVNSLKDVCSEKGKEDQDTFQKVMEMTDDEIRGLEFETIQKAIDFYVVYAKCHGFAARKHVVERDHSGNIVVRQLVCNREGINNKSRSEKAKNPRPTIRTNCPAKFRVAYNFVADRWRVSVFQSSHNHELTPANYVHMIPNYRRLSESDKALVDGLHTHGVKTCHIMGFMLAQKGGYRGLGFCKKDLYNYLSGQVRVRVEDGDAFAALSYLQAKGDNDPMFYAKFTTTSEGKLENLFWSDSTSRGDYRCFGDVIAFDTTYKKNKYNKPLVIFSGYNHHGQTTIFGCALVSDESAPTYKWVLNAFLDAMDHKHPKGVVTDGDLAMREAINEIFPDSMHRLCSWHLNKNACENVKNPKFLEEFNKLLYATYTVDKFETEWKRVVDEYGLAKLKWIKKTYKTRTMWASAYMRDKFFCGVRTTSICEGINKFIKMYVETKNSLVDFIHNFERAVKHYRNNELLSDFQTFYYPPVLKTKLHGIELGASKIFTRNKFIEVQNQIEDATTLNVIERAERGNSVMLKMNKFSDRDNTYLVCVDKEENKFLCDCGSFERVGIPCAHIICAMKNEYINVFPDNLICKRWTKSAKDDCFNSTPSDVCDKEKIVMLRRGAMSSAFNTLCNISCENPDDYKEAMDAIYSIREKIKRRREGKEKCNTNSSVIGDPDVVKTKGAPRKRKSFRKKRRCSHCKKTGHTKRRCPILAGRDDLHEVEEEVSSSQSDYDTNSDASLDDRYEDVDKSCGYQADTKLSDFNQESINKRTSKQDVDTSCGNQANTKVTEHRQDSFGKKTSKRVRKEKIGQSSDGLFAPNHTNVQTHDFVYGNHHGFGYAPSYFAMPNGVPMLPHFPPTVNMSSHSNTTMYPGMSNTNTAMYPGILNPNTSMYPGRNQFMGALEEVERAAKEAKRG